MEATSSPGQDAVRDGDAVSLLVRENDPDRWLATLFAPADKRAGLLALYAFNLEIARVRELVSDPLPGEVRFQWWRDALEDKARGDVRGHPVATALLEAIGRYRLPRQALLDLIEARTFDLYDDPMPSVGALEGYCGETSSALIRLASLVLAGGDDPGGADAAGHAGVAYAITGLLRALPWHASRGQVYLPADLMARHGVGREDIVSGRDSEGLRAALSELRDLARHHLDETRARIRETPAEIAPAFLPVALVSSYLARMERRDYHPFRTRVELPRWRAIWLLWRAARSAG
ncbi:squalene/phytoene synthase family protein [Alsobacter sp. SYSU M60028]|uniref:Squalene/phytoene synthase family protein n=1 Tax=Alsobacter ponti TaxID=2962936 RepID=A0ABT1LCW9_9HYPH|nr:phytoene/squalene synthase family protein [Alsobacter ponti]MCP8939337.1 squalene/phytoene synthase family protein [Alsobacter ponti]